jgi:hypothetical protein
VSRYLNSQNKLPFAIKDEESMKMNEHIMHKRGTHDHFGLYASNYRYKNTDISYYDLAKEQNIIFYDALIDIDNTRQNLDLFKHIMRVLIIPKLPKNGTFMVVSGNGHHVRIMGFKSHFHAAKFVNDNFGIFNIKPEELDTHLKKNKVDRYTYSLLKEMYKVGMHVDLLNDIGRIATVPYSLYKYDKNIVCVPFDVKDVENYENSWSDILNPRIPSKVDLWNNGISEEVTKFNELKIDYIIEQDKKRYERVMINNDPFDPDCMPDCVRKAMDHNFADGRRRIVMFIATFLYTLGFEDNIIYEICRQRDETYTDQLGENITEQIVSEVLKKGLVCPKCSKVNNKDDKFNQYPYLSLGDFELCKYIPEGKFCLNKLISPVDVYSELSRYFKSM